MPRVANQRDPRQRLHVVAAVVALGDQQCRRWRGQQVPGVRRQPAQVQQNAAEIWLGRVGHHRGERGAIVERAKRSLAAATYQVSDDCELCVFHRLFLNAVVYL